jgi:hypothetical protein
MVHGVAVTPILTEKREMSSVKSQVFVKATAELAQEVLEKDLTAKAKNMGEILNEVTRDSNRRTVHGSVPKSDGTNKEEV